MRMFGLNRGVSTVRSVKRRVFRSATLVAMVGVLVITGLTSASAGAAAAGSEGVDAKSVTIGYITSKTGVAGSTFQNADTGCKARIGRANAEGGVNGRKINVEYADDQSSQNLTVEQDLVQNKHVFMVVNNSPFAFLGYRFLLQNGVPMIGGGYDGVYYGDPGNEAIVSASGNVVNVNGVSYTLLPNVMKEMGASKVAALAYGVSASSTAAANNLQKLAVPQVGLKAVYTNTTIDFGTTDVGAPVLGIKNAGADAVYLPMVANSNLAVVQGLAQNGVKMKSEVLATGYGQDLLDQPAAQTFGPEVVMQTGFAPVELKTKATKQFQADLKKYANFTKIPDYGVYTGYISCELAVLGLKNAGNPPTREAYVPNLRKVGTYDQAGLACQPVDISSATFGKAPPTNCGWFVQVKNGKFVVLNQKNGKAIWTGKLIAASTQATTTTAGPSG
jgi:branched-chain amino acid transport system substrate-binding protein